MHGRYSFFQQRRIAVEKMDKLGGKKQCQQPRADGIKNADDGGKADSLPNPLEFACAVIKAHDRLCAIGHTHHRQRQYFPHCVDHRHDSHIEIPSIDGKGQITDHLHGTIGHRHNKTGHSQPRNFPENPKIRFHPDKFQPINRLFSRQEPQHPNCGKSLRNYRGQCCSANAHLQPENQNRVENDIHHSAQQHRQHSHFAESLRVDETVHSQADHHKNCADQINFQIIIGISEGVLTGAKEIQQRLFKGKAHHHQYDARNHQRQKGIAHDLAGIFVLPFSPGDGAQRRSTHTE